MRKKYEFKTGHELKTEQLNEIGQHGWSIVAGGIAPNGHMVYVFQREIIETEAAGKKKKKD